MSSQTSDPTTTDGLNVRALAPPSDYSHGADSSPGAANLFLALDCGAPLTAPVRIGLTRVQEVVLCPSRSRSVDTQLLAGKQIVTIGTPDPGINRAIRILIRAEGAPGRSTNGVWRIPPRAMAGAIVAEASEELGTAASDGDVFSCGNSIFVFRQGGSQADESIRGVAPLRPATESNPALETLQPRLTRQFQRLQQIARSPISVMILGETGTGKELVARTIHALSGRPGRMVAINCGALSETLLLSELFGHRKGAFSGAVEEREGLVRAADRGTLLLDEIGDLPFSGQAAFLRVLQEREVHPIGATRPVPLDIRVVSATHRDLDALVRAGAFRADLYARLLGYYIELPPLRLRPEDIGLIVGNLARRWPRPESVSFTPAAACVLFRHSWPLNIRELERYLTTALVFAEGNPIDVPHLADSMRMERASPLHHSGSVHPGMARPRQARQDNDTRQVLVHLLERSRGNVSAVAAQMRTSRTQIHRWARRFGLDLAAYRVRIEDTP